jgi:hypothetical protein
VDSKYDSKKIKIDNIKSIILYNIDENNYDDEEGVQDMSHEKNEDGEMEVEEDKPNND